MTIPVENLVSIRFVLNLPTEDPSYVDVDFVSTEQALDALTTLKNATGRLISIDNAYATPVLLRPELVAAAFQVEYAEDEEEEDDDEDEEDEEENGDDDSDDEDDE